MDVNQMCAYDLRNELRRRGLSTSGKIVELRARLQGNIDAAPAITTVGTKYTRASDTVARVTIPQATAAAPAHFVTRASAVAVSFSTISSSVQMPAIAQPSAPIQQPAIVQPQSRIQPPVPVPPACYNRQRRRFDILLTMHFVLFVVIFGILIKNNLL